MDIAVTLLIGTGAVLAWFVLAGVIALLAGRVIHERDAHDRPAERAKIRLRPALARH